jgi:hypothetical protein
MEKYYRFLVFAAFLTAAASVAFAQAPVMSVKITSPSSGSQIAKCSELDIAVDPQIQGGEIKNVALIRNNIYTTAKIKAPWEFKIKNYPPGYYVFIARLTAKTGEVVYSDPVAVTVGNTEKGNILSNGEFDCGTSPWALGQNQGATATYAVDTSAWISTGAAAVVTMENGGTATWHVQLQQAFAVDSGHTYLLSFTAQSTENSKLIDIVFQQNKDPYTVYYQVSPTIEALQDYGPFTWECPVTDHEAFIRFNIGFTNNTTFWLDNVKVFDVSLTGLKDRNPLNAGEVPDRCLVSRNYPNPFNPRTTIEYRLPDRADVTLTVFNLRGQAVATLVRENQAPGEHLASWNGESGDGERVPSGVYVYRLEAKAPDMTYSLSRKIMMLE